MPEFARVRDLDVRICISIVRESALGRWYHVGTVNRHREFGWRSRTLELHQPVKVHLVERSYAVYDDQG
jgi:hypothetical protein